MKKAALLFICGLILLGIDTEKTLANSRATTERCSLKRSNANLTMSGDTKCTDCHSDLLNKPIKHEGALMGCDGCHAAHDTPTSHPKQLTDTVKNLCFQCHDEEALLGGCLPGVPCNHPASGHPIEGPRDPLYPEKEFNCASCHDPHSSDTHKLFRYKIDGSTPYQGNSCAVCHYDHAFPGPKPPTPPWR